MRALDVREVDALALDDRPELRHRVELVLDAPPVEPVEPVAAQLAQVAEIGPLRPGFRRRILGPARGAKAAAQILEHRLGDVDAERLDGHPVTATISPFA